MNSRRPKKKQTSIRTENDEFNDNQGDYGDALSLLPTASSAAAPPPHPPPPANVDPALLHDISEAVSLFETLMVQKPNNSFTRRSSVIYTKTPAKDLYKKSVVPRGKNDAKSVPGRKRGDPTDKDQSKNFDDDADGAGGLSLHSSPEKHSENLIAMKQLVEELEKKISEKDELIKAAEDDKNQMSLLQASYNDLKQQCAERDYVVQSTELNLSDAKIKLADKQAALEKAQWEALTSNQKRDKLQEEIDSLQKQMSSYMLLFESLSQVDQDFEREDYEVEPYCMDPLPGIDEMDENEMLEMEAATKLYLAAVAAAKERPDEESLQAAANARLHLQSFVFKEICN